MSDSVKLDSISVLGLMSDGTITAIVLTPEERSLLMGLLAGVCHPVKVCRLTKADGIMITDPATGKTYQNNQTGWV